MEEKIILVDLHDRQTGVEYKLEAHKKDMLHRAFSVFIFKEDELLIQKRASAKYHSAGLRANTCCSHPRDGELLTEAAHRRLREEAGFDTELIEAGSFVYREVFPNDLTEYEYDHVLVGTWAGSFQCNPEEAEEMKYIRIDDLEKDVRENPSCYAAWFPGALAIALKNYERH